MARERFGSGDKVALWNVVCKTGGLGKAQIGWGIGLGGGTWLKSLDTSLLYARRLGPWFGKSEQTDLAGPSRKREGGHDEVCT